MYCKYCGSKVEENSRFCPNCGHEIEVEKKEEVSVEYVEESTSMHKTASSTDTKEDTYALVGFILALASFFTGITCIPGLILSILGRRSEKNKGMATAGIILSIIPLVFFVFILFIFLFAFGIAAAA